MDIRILTDAIPKQEVAKISERQFGDMVKAVVDVRRHIMALGGELHADAEALLLEQGSKQADLWGINLYHKKTDTEWIEFNSLINIRPSQNNRSRGVDNTELQQAIRAVVASLVTD